jgi:aryl-alcohol dehydrogenase-like predicted oxidoreductase
MEQRSLGRSGIDVSLIGFGCGGNAHLMVSEDQELRLATLQRAVDAGINYFDTAPAYGDGRSELNLGRGLLQLGVKPVISTKVVLRAGDLSDPASAVVRSAESSLIRLARSQVDILVLHNRVFESSGGGGYGVGAKLGPHDIFGPRGVAAGFERLLTIGVTRMVGFTAFGGDISAITRLIDSGLFGALNVSINLINPSAAVQVPSSFPEPNYEEIIAHAHEAGMGVMAIQVLARGALTGHGPRTGRGSHLARAALAFDESLPSVAIRYALGKCGVTTAILGFSEPEHVDEAVAAAAKGRLPVEIEHTLESLAVV